jgi:8-oxo-dGTP diphosphatase
MEMPTLLHLHGERYDHCDGNKVERLSVGVKCIIFGFDGQQLKLLLTSHCMDKKEEWSLLNGYVKKGEGPDAAASRILEQFTGIQNVYYEQLYSFGGFRRDVSDCEISIVYVALLNISDFHDRLSMEHEARWFSFTEISSLFFQYWDIVLKARAYFQEKVLNYPIAFELLPPKFTLTQLQNLLEAIYDISFDRSNFTKKILSLGILKKLNEKEKLDSRKGSYYFMFDKSNYKRSDLKNINFNWK